MNLSKVTGNKWLHCSSTYGARRRERTMEVPVTRAYDFFFRILDGTSQTVLLPVITKKSHHGIGGKATLSRRKEGGVAFGVPLGQSCINPKVLESRTRAVRQ